MKNLSLVVFSFFLSASAYCQQHFLPGYILTNNSDTMHVELQEENGHELMLQVTYKRDVQSATVSTAKPGEISEFGYIGGDVYKTISFLDNPSDSTLTKTYFAKQLLAGTYDLFVYPKNDQKIYVIRNGNHYYLLTNSTYMRSGEIDEQGNYQSQLLYLSVPCHIPQTDIERIAFDDQNIIKFTTQLNHCVNPGKAVVNYYHKDKSKFEVLAFVGAFPSNSSFQLSAEVLARFSYPQMNRNVYFNVGLRYSHSPFITFARTSGYSKYQINTTDILLSVPATVQYNFTTGRIKPYLGFGFSVGVLKETNSDFSGQRVYNNFKFAAVVELGIEAKLVDKLFAKAAWRYEAYMQCPVVGIAYKFK